MTITLKRKYKCDKCSAPAIKHLQCGLLIADALAIGVNIFTMPYIASHFDLCDCHLLAANTTYVHYDESDLDLYHLSQSVLS